MRSLLAVPVLALLGMAITDGVRAAAPDIDNPDWPCIQRKVPHLSAAQMWDGPSVDDLSDWHADPELAKLAAEIAARRLPVEDAVTMIRAYAETIEPKARDAKLTRLFAGALAIIDEHRSTLINGIERYYRRQKQLADAVKAEAEELTAVRKQAATDETARAKLADLQAKYDWSTRVFGERMESLSFVCETPVLLEQRAFELAREIRNLMSE